MKRVQDKMITEQVLLSACKENDRVNIHCKVNLSSWCGIGCVILKKVKSIGRGMLQIKYHSSPNRKILKANIPDTLMVSRTRKWTTADREADAL